MTGRAHPAPAESDGEKALAGRSDSAMPATGDPSHELFSRGWTPQAESPVEPEAYEGRHRAPDA